MSRRLGTCAWLAAALWWVFASLALAQTPSNDDALLDQAEALLAQGDHNAASALANVVVARHATPRAHGVLGLALSHGADHATAESALQRALQTPADPWVARNKSRIYQQLAALSSAPPSTPTLSTPAPASTTTAIAPSSTAATNDSAAHEAPPPDAPSESTIPQDWLRAFPAGTEPALSASDGWSDSMRINVGLALGLRNGLAVLYRRVDTGERPVDVTLYPYSGVGPSGFGIDITATLGLLLGLSHMVEFAPRFDLTLAPGTAGGRVGDSFSDDSFEGGAWITIVALSPGLRFRTAMGSPVYFGVVPRIGVFSASLSGSLPVRGMGSSGSEPIDAGFTEIFYGGEVSVGALLDEGALWDFSVRVQGDIAGGAVLVGLERRVY